MDENIIKTEISGYTTVLDKTKEQPIDADFTLPEYYPDVSRILKCHACAYISSKGMNGNALLAEGTAVITVIYVDNDNMLNSYEYRYPFSKSFDTDPLTGEVCARVTAAVDYLNCRAVTARKIDIHGAVSVMAVASVKTAREIITGTDLTDVEMLEKNVSVGVPLFCNEKTLTVEDEVEISSAKGDINCVLRYSGNVCLTESKLIAGKIMTKGELSADILYCGDDGLTENVREVIPFAQMLETEGADENCAEITKAELCRLEVKPKSDADGKLRSFSVNAGILLTSRVFKSDAVAVLSDVYSRKYEITAAFTETTLCGAPESISESFAAKHRITLPGGVSKVVDLRCAKRRCACRVEGDKLKAEGALLAEVLYYDKNGLPQYGEGEIPFDFEAAADCDRYDCAGECDIGVCGCSFIISGEDELEIKAEAMLSALVSRCEKTALLTGLEINRDKPAAGKKDCAMAVYYAAAGERLWDIAKSYLADEEEIKKINGVGEETLTEDTMLLIPLI